MDPYEYGRDSRFRPERRRISWLLPLVLGIGIGALALGLFSGFGWGHDNRRGSFAAALPGNQQQWSQPAPNSAQQPVVPQFAPRAGAPFQRGLDQNRHGGVTQGRWGWFFPFGSLRFIGPLLLIGLGAWLLSGRRFGSGGSSGPSAPQPPHGGPTTTVAAPVEPQPARRDEPPATSETQRL